MNTRNAMPMWFKSKDGLSVHTYRLPESKMTLPPCVCVCVCVWFFFFCVCVCVCCECLLYSKNKCENKKIGLPCTVFVVWSRDSEGDSVRKLRDFHNCCIRFK